MKLELGKKARGLEGQTLIEATDVSFSWPGGVELFHHQSFRIFYGDRIGMVGRNGVGKSTLFELICAERSPTSGKIERAVKLQIARFTQEMEDLPQAGNVLMSLQALVPDWTEGECRAHLARFQFLGEDIEKAVATLSGGEKRRLCLARLVTSHFDLLLLDEPTNHLDISTRESLEESLKATKMTIVAISHDRHFLAEVLRASSNSRAIT